MPEYDFVSSVREELEQLAKELASPEMHQTLGEVARRLKASERETLAALWRASKRHGETLAVFAGELNHQFEREAARAAAESASAAGAGAPQPTH